MGATVTTAHYNGVVDAPKSWKGNVTANGFNLLDVGNVACATINGAAVLAVSFVLTGDLGGTLAAPTVVQVGGVTAANVAAGANLANAATALNTLSAIVRRDVSGNFAAGTITANLTGNVTGNCSGSAGSVAWANVTGKPTALSAFTNDTNFITLASVTWANVTGKPTALSAFTNDLDTVLGKANLATAGKIPYVSAAGTLNEDSAFAWDATNHRLGIGVAGTMTGAPLGILHTEGIVHVGGGSAGVGNSGGEIRLRVNTGSTDTVGGAAIKGLIQFGGESNGQAMDLAFYTNARTGTNTYSGLTERLRIASSGYVSIGGTAQATAWHSYGFPGGGALAQSGQKCVMVYADGSSYRLGAYDFGGSVAAPLVLQYWGGHLIVGAPNAALADASIGSAQFTIWINEATNALTFRVKYSTGTLKTGTIALA